jgi:nucleoside-triphosphatase
MSDQKPAILLTGSPGIGKTTVIKQILEQIEGRAGGFYTREVRRGRTRVSFEMVTLDGKIGLLATLDQKINLPGSASLGRYRVNVTGVNDFAVPALLHALEERKTIIIDEIGPMEIFSEKFCEVVKEILSRKDIAVIGTIVKRPYRFADAVKNDRRVNLKEVTLKNRDILAREIITLLGRNGG